MASRAQYAVDNGKALAYGLKNVTKAMAQEACDKATESYAKEVLHWPNGRLAKPDIFSPVDAGQFENLGDCTKHFAAHLLDLFRSSPLKQLPTYPHAFLVISKEEMPSYATLVLAYKSRGRWQLEHRSIPVYVEFGQPVESLRFSDETAEEILDRYALDNPTETTEQYHGMSDAPSAEKWGFAVFSTGLASALPLPALIDPSTDEARPSEATPDLIGDPETSRFQMCPERMKQLFPVICRNDERRGWRTNGMSLHKKVFICCDNDQPEDKGVLAMQMEWNGDTQKSNKELQNVGKAATVRETRVGVKEALAKARETAERSS
jgi:hypothetical protein